MYLAWAYQKAGDKQLNVSPTQLNCLLPIGSFLQPCRNLQSQETRINSDQVIDVVEDERMKSIDGVGIGIKIMDGRQLPCTDFG